MADTKDDKKEESPRPVVRLTESAVSKIKSMMGRDGKQGYGLRVGVITGGCAGLSYDLRFQKEPYENDVVFEQDDVKIFVNSESISFLKGSEIDYTDKLNQSGFQYRNPNAQSSCGCGLSFS